jgi:hypothetical protein
MRPERAGVGPTTGGSAPTACPEWDSNSGRLYPGLSGSSGLVPLSWRDIELVTAG